MKGFLLCFCFGIFTLPTFAVPITPDSACPRESLDLLKAWDSLNDWRGSAPEADGNPVLISPSKKIGTWVQLITRKDGSTVLRRIDSFSIVEVSFNPKCERRLVVMPKLLPESSSLFTDLKLEALIKKSFRVLIYVWSPHMPYSVRGFSEAQSYAQKNNYDFLALLDPQADQDFAIQVATKNHFPAKSLQRNASNELRMRGMLLHFPSMLVYDAKTGFSPILPGYVEAPIFKKVVESWAKK